MEMEIVKRLHGERLENRRNADMDLRKTDGDGNGDGDECKPTREDKERFIKDLHGSLELLLLIVWSA